MPKEGDINRSNVIKMPNRKPPEELELPRHRQSAASIGMTSPKGAERVSGNAHRTG
jgi:hypothetical protein